MTFRAGRFFILALVWVVLSGCATYQANVVDAKVKIRQGEPAAAAKLVEEKAFKTSDDQLVYLLDYATALQLAGDFKASNKAYQEADKLSDIQDYHSVSRVTASLLLSEEMVQYKGDDYEKVLINAQTAVNYLMTNELDDALVETRRLNNKLYKYKYEAKKNYEQNPFAFYLGAVIWEADGKWDDAYISYKSAFELAPQFAPLREDLVRAAIRASREEDVAKWKKEFPDVKVKPEWKDPTYGELVVIYQQGWGPHKAPRPESPRFPRLVHTPSRTRAIELVVDGTPRLKSEPIYSVEDVAIKTLEDDYAALVAKRVAGIVAKEVVADQIRQKNELLGAVAWVALHVSDRADLRQWSTLPETFHIARLRLKAGTYKVNLVGEDGSGAKTGEDWGEHPIEIKAKKKTFIGWRSVQ